VTTLRATAVKLAAEHIEDHHLRQQHGKRVKVEFYSR